MTDRDRARAEVVRRRSDLKLSQAALAREAGVAVNTVRGFLQPGGVWPQTQTLAAIERALRWPTGSIESIADGADAPPISRTDEFTSDRAADGERPVTLAELPSEAREVVVLMTPDFDAGWTDLERAEWQAGVQLDALRRAREMNASARTRREDAPAP